MPKNHRQFAAFVTKHRLRAGLTQPELADRIGTTKSNVHYWESGVGVPMPQKLEALARGLNVSYESLYAVVGYALADPTTAEYFRRQGYPREAVAEIERAVARVDRKFPNRRKGRRR